MKLYIKANSLKILKNYETLLPYAHAKTKPLLTKESNHTYATNLRNAEILQQHSATLFYDTRPLQKVLKGVYFGNSSCEHLVPKFSEIVEARDFCQKRHLNFVFVFAPLSQFKMQEAQEILAFLATKEKSEVVVNDMGTLQMVLEYPQLVPILGLDFTKVIKNAFIDAIEPSELTTTQLQNQKELMRHLEFELQETRAFYKKIGVGRFSVENISLDLSFLNEVPRMNLDFYYPYITIANSKACDIAGSFEDERGYFVHTECPRYCNFASLEFAHTEVLGLRQRYNTIYKTSNKIELPDIVYKNGRNRFVWELFL